MDIKLQYRDEMKRRCISSLDDDSLIRATAVECFPELEGRGFELQRVAGHVFRIVEEKVQRKMPEPLPVVGAAAAAPLRFVLAAPQPSKVRGEGKKRGYLFCSCALQKVYVASSFPPPLEVERPVHRRTAAAVAPSADEEDSSDELPHLLKAKRDVVSGGFSSPALSFPQIPMDLISGSLSPDELQQVVNKALATPEVQAVFARLVLETISAKHEDQTARAKTREDKKKRKAEQRALKECIEAAAEARYQLDAPAREALKQRVATSRVGGGGVAAEEQARAHLERVARQRAEEKREADLALQECLHLEAEAEARYQREAPAREALKQQLAGARRWDSGTAAARARAQMERVARCSAEEKQQADLAMQQLLEAEAEARLQREEPTRIGVIERVPACQAALADAERKERLELEAQVLAETIAQQERIVREQREAEAKERIVQAEAEALAARRREAELAVAKQEREVAERALEIAEQQRIKAAAKAEGPQLSAVETERAQTLQALKEMGFVDEVHNIELYVRHGNNLDAIVQQLIEHGQGPW